MPIVKVSDCSLGVNTDLPVESLGSGVWSSVTNMRFLDGHAQRFRGMQDVFTAPSITPYWVAPYQTSTKRYWVHAGTQKVFVDDGTTRTEITPASLFTGAQDDRWTGGVLGGVLVMNNGVDQPQFWAGNVANDLANLTGWNANWRCGALVPFKNYLVALNITKSGTNYPHMVKWSHTAVAGTIPASWDETDPTKDAGEQDLAETSDFLVDALPLGDTLVIYKERSMYAMSYVGYPYIFQFKRIPGEFGMLSRGCGAVTPVGHVVMGTGDVYLFNGQGAESISDGSVRKFIFSNLDQTNYKRAFVCTSPKTNEVLVCIPQSGQSTCTLAAVWNWKTRQWGFRTLSNVTYGGSGLLDWQTSTIWSTDTESWDSDGSEWPENEFSKNEGRLVLSRATAISAYDVGTTDFGSSITSVLERTGMSLDDGQTMKLVKAVFPRIDAPDGTDVTVEVGASMYPDKPPAWGAPTHFTVGYSHKVDALVQGRYLAIRFTCSKPWRMRAFDMDVVATGTY